MGCNIMCTLLCRAIGNDVWCGFKLIHVQLALDTQEQFGVSRRLLITIEYL